jgi:hypothetical protein
MYYDKKNPDFHENMKNAVCFFLGMKTKIVIRSATKKAP